ncbi:FkbM family methyltransferase [Shewanella maritima]|nr:FkbM family methyltransferase [Shewanella maritima]
MTEIYIFGAGIQGEIFLNTIKPLPNINPIGIIDGFSNKTSVQGLAVLRPEPIANKDVPIYISVGLISSKIKAQLLSQGFTKVYDFTESLHAFPAIIEQLKVHSLWFDQDQSKRVDGAGIEQFRHLLSDDKSRQLLDQIVRFRTDFDIADYPIPDSQIQYFCEDVPALATLERIRFIDAGAYIGDTLEQLFFAADKYNKVIEYCASFEPDTANLTRLSRTSAKLSQTNSSAHIFVYPAGVWSESAQLSFDASQNTSSKLSLDSLDATTINCVALDDVVYSAKPNFIKMDVEGAEVAALNGARNIIQDYTPVLAICLYHTPSDLWKIPALINEMNPNYDMYLRVYGDMLLETVLYCVPKPSASTLQNT